MAVLKKSHQKSNAKITYKSSVFSSEIVKFEIWHYRLGHLSNSRLKILQNKVTNVSCSNSESPCDICHFAKQKKLPFPLSSSVSSACFDLVHIDIWGPASTSSFYGHKFFLTIVDDYSRFTWIFLMK